MSFNEDELQKIKKTTSGPSKKSARSKISKALMELKPKVEAVKLLEQADRKVQIQSMIEEAIKARHRALKTEANSYGHPNWAAAAACESWLNELNFGTPESISRIEEIVDQLINRK